jgi:hypothetical protein
VSVIKVSNHLASRPGLGRVGRARRNRAAKIAPNAAKGPSSWPLPGARLGVCDGSAVTGAGPSGSMIGSCATAGVADAKAQIAAADSNMTDKRFMFLAPVEPDEPLPH